MPSLFMAPMVFAAIGTNGYDCVSGAYLAIFLFAAVSAAAPYRSSMVLTSHHRVRDVTRKLTLGRLKPMASAGARAYNGGLGGGQGSFAPLKVIAFLWMYVHRSRQISPIFRV